MIEFRYDFGEKLDLSKFAKQAEHYIACWYAISYHIYTQDFIIEASVRPNDSSKTHKVDFSLYELERDSDKSIINKKLLFPLNDTRFSNIEIIIELFARYNDQGQIFSDNVFDIIAKLCQLIKAVHKINHLKAFL